jgi:hypothetical protein
MWKFTCPHHGRIHTIKVSTDKLELNLSKDPGYLIISEDGLIPSKIMWENDPTLSPLNYDYWSNIIKDTIPIIGGSCLQCQKEVRIEKR